MKRRFLVVYDYGQGGVWAYVLAGSQREIEEKFPELKVFEKPPGWMSRADLSKIGETSTFDIDREEGLLATIKNERRVGGEPRSSGRSGAAG